MVLMTVLHRLITAEDWLEANRRNRIEPSDLDKVSGFVHLSRPEQSAQTAELYFKPETKPLVLELNVDGLADSLKWEWVESRGEEMPHLYRELKFDDVLGVRVVNFTKTGVMFGESIDFFGV